MLYRFQVLILLYNNAQIRQFALDGLCRNPPDLQCVYPVNQFGGTGLLANITAKIIENGKFSCFRYSITAWLAIIPCQSNLVDAIFLFFVLSLSASTKVRIVSS